MGRARNVAGAVHDQVEGEAVARVAQERQRLAAGVVRAGFVVADVAR
jgi:hypothetical protein